MQQHDPQCIFNNVEPRDEYSYIEKLFPLKFFKGKVHKHQRDAISLLR